MLFLWSIATLLLVATADVGIASGDFERFAKKNIRESKRKLRLKNARDNLAQAIKTKIIPSATDQRALAGDDDYYFDDVSKQYSNFQFNVTNYSLKYARCQTIQSYSDEYGQEEFADTVLKRQTFAVFRFCNSDYCSSDQMFGCDMDYGEYLIDLNDYLEIMKEYNEERKEAYCDYCEECMDQDEEDNAERNRRRLDENQNEENGDEGENQDEGEEEGNEEEGNEEEGGDDGDAAGDDGAAAGDDGAAAGDDGGAAGDDGGAAGDDGGAAGDDGGAAGDDGGAAGDDGGAAGDDGAQHACEYYDQCYNYQDTCEDNDDAVDYDELLNCAEYPYGDDDGAVYFVGPTCSSDGVSIQLGVFSDNECTEFVDSNVDIENLIGMDIDEDGFANYYPSSCISCRESDLPWQQVDGDQDDEDEVSEVCENLWVESAKCNRYYDAVMANSYGSEEQENTEKLVCYYIQNIVSGQYNEHGEIYVDVNEYDQQTAPHDAVDEYEVTTEQLTYMGVSLVVCFALLMYSCHLHRLIINTVPWSPRREKGAAAEAGAISRQSSGILIGRSKSAGDYYGGTLA